MGHVIQIEQINKMKPSHIAFFISTLACLTGIELLANDWPQILGPKRDGVAAGEKLFKEWPKAGPREIWSKPCGQGYAGVAVKDNKVILFHRVGTNDIVECLDANSGKQLWKTETKSVYRGGFSSDLGPRCVPTISGETVYVFGAAGTLRCLKLANGKPLWKRDLFSDYKANEGYFGAGSSPLVLGAQIIVTVGGRNGGVIALRPESGETIWKTDSITASYSAPTQISYNGKPAVAALNKLTFQIIASKSGKLLYETEFGKRGPTVNAALPLVFDDKLFLSSSYNVGARLINLADGNKTIWENDSSMSSQYTTCVYHEGFLYGTNGREDFGNGALRCVNALTGKVAWDEEQFGLAHLIKVEDQMLIWNIDGTVTLADLNSKSFLKKESAIVFSGNAKSLPALSNGRLFVKSNAESGSGKIVCLQVGESK